jgi:hypothetical protein
MALISGHLLLAALSFALGFLVTEVLLANRVSSSRQAPQWLEGERTDGWTDASWSSRSSQAAM